MSAYLSVRLSSCLCIGSSFSLSLSLSPAATVVTEADSHMDSEPSKQLVEREEEGSCDSGGVVMSMSCDPVAIENESTAERNAGEMKIESEVRVRGMVAESVGEMGRGSRVGSEQGQVLGVSLESVVVGDVEERESESMVCDSVAGVQHGELTVSTGEEEQEKVPLGDTHYATQGVSERSCDMEGSSCNVEVDSHDQSHDKDERSCDMQVESHDKDRSQDMQVESHDKDRSHDMQVESHGKEVRSHDMQVESHDKEVRSHDMQLESHDKEVRSHDMQLESHDKKERSHDMQLQSHDRKVESLDKDEGSDDTEMVSHDISESQSDSMERKSYTDDIQGTSHTEHSHRVHVESGDIESKSRDVQWKSDYVQEERTYGEEPVNRDLLVSTDVSSHDLHQVSHGFEAESHSAVGIPHATDEKLTDPTLEHGELCDMANSSLEVQVGSGDEWVEQQEAGQPHPPDEIQEYREFEETKLRELRQSHNKVGAEISLEMDAGTHDVQEAKTPLGTTQPHSEESSTAGDKEHEEQVSATEGLVQRVSYGESQDVPPHSAEEGVGAEKRCLLERAVESGNKEDGGHLVRYGGAVHLERESHDMHVESHDHERESHDPPKEASHDQERESHDPPKEASHDQERESHDPPKEASHDQERESHDPPEEASHDQQRESHDPPKEASHDQERESHDPPKEASHDQERESHDPPKEASHDQERESHDPPKEASHDQERESHDPSHDQERESHDPSHDQERESHDPPKASHDQERESHDPPKEALHDQEREHDIQGESHDQEKESHDMQGESKESSRDQNRNSHDHQERMEVVVPDRTAEPPPTTAPGEVKHPLNETDSIDRMLESSVSDSLQQKSHDTVVTLVQGDGPVSEETAVSYGETTLPNADQAVRENHASRAEAEMETQTAVDEGQEHSSEEAMELDQVGDNWGNPSHLASVDPQSSGPCESQGGDDQNNNKNTVHQQTHHTGSEVHSDRLQRMSHDGETRSHDTGFKSCDPGVDEESTPQPMETESEIREVHSSEGTVATAVDKVQGESYQKEAVPADGAKPHEQSCDEEAKSYEQSHDEEAKSHEQAHVEEAKSYEESRDDEAKSRDEEVKSHEQPHDEEAKPLNEEGKSHEQSCDEGAKSHDQSKVGESESHTTEYQLVQRQTESHGIIAGDTSSTTSAMIEESCEDTGDSADNSGDIVPMVEGELSSQEELHGSRVGGSEVDSQEELHGSRGGGSSDGDTRGGVCQSQEETEGALYPSYAATEVCSLDSETKIDGKLSHNPGSESPDLPNQPSEEEEQSYTDTQSRSHDGGTEVCGDQEPMPQVGEQDSHETKEKSGDSDSKPTDGGNEPITHSREPADISDGRGSDSTNARGFDNSNDSPDSELKSHDNEPKSHESQPESRDSQVESRDSQVESRDAESKSHGSELKSYGDTDLKSHDIELESCGTELKSHDSELSSRDTEPLKAHESELKPHDPPSHELKFLENETQSSNYESSECEGERLDDVKPSGNDVTSDIEGVSCEAEAKEEVGGACVTMETVEEREFAAASNRVVSMATELLEKWEGLKEVFRIPKRTQSVSEIQCKAVHCMHVHRVFRYCMYTKMESEFCGYSVVN